MRTISFSKFALPCFVVGVLLSSSVIGQDLIKPAPDMPVYTLGGIQQGKDQFGKPSITISYKRNIPSPGFVKLAGRTADGPLDIMGGMTVLQEQSGTIQLSAIFGKGNLNAEIYLVSPGSFAEQVPYTCLVSNVVRAGNLSGPGIVARDWNEKEKAAYQRDLLGRKPPASPPAGYQLATPSTQLIPGMPAKVGFYGEWKDAEILTNSARVTVRISNSENLRLLGRDGWIALSPEVIKKSQTEPKSFRPSLQVIPGTTSIIPDGYTVVAADMSLVPGVPVRATWLNKMVDATVRAIDGNQLMIHFDGQANAFDKLMPRSEVLIATEVLPKLALPDAKDTFAKRLPVLTETEKEMERFNADAERQMNEAMENGRKEAERIRQQVAADMAKAGAGASGLSNGLPKLPLLEENAMVTLRVPKEAEPLPLNLKLPKGTKLAACWGPQWAPLTVIEDCEEERVPVRWVTQNRESSIHRSQLIILKPDLKRLKLEVAKSTSRPWKDATGKFTIEAVFVSKSGANITLKKADGKEITLPILKLSKEDQAWIKENL